MRSVSVLVIALLPVASCDKAKPSAPDTATSSAPNAATAKAEECHLNLAVYPPPGVSDLRQSVVACVERSAALYAKGPDTPEDISKAVEVECKPYIIPYVEQEARKAGQQPQYNEVLEAWRQQALPVIAEARARGCYS